VKGRGHRTFGLFAHVTWHTWRRQNSVRRADVETVARAIRDAASRNSVHVVAQAVLADHVHVLVSFLPERALTPFVRDAKSESARRVNRAGLPHLRWARGYYAGSISHGHIPVVRSYLGRQHQRHPDRVPA